MKRKSSSATWKILQMLNKDQNVGIIKETKDTDSLKVF